MDWARDQLGNLIHASQQRLFSYGLSCPTCGEPVRRRAGPERRPHFAHYSHSAKPECEHYHPSWPTDGRQRYFPGGTDKLGQPTGIRSASGIFLERTEQGSFSLYLKLPQLVIGIATVGEIEIRTGLGIRTYTASQLNRPLYVPVVARRPLAEVAASDDLVAIGMATRSEISRFRESGNFFRMNDTRARLMAPEEPLEWGEKYWLLTSHALRPFAAHLGLQVECKEERRGWYVYELALATLSPTHSASRALAQYLGRAIRAPYARAYFAEPPPHHIELDGTHIFPETTERIVIRRTALARVSIEGITGAIIGELADEWLEIKNLRVGSFMVLVEEREALLGRIEECELFQPRGVRLTVGTSSWEIFEPEAHEIICQGPHHGIEIKCPTMRVAERVSLDPNAWLQDGTRFTFTGTPPVAIDAENFGSLFWPLEEEPRVRLDQGEEARRAWLEGVIASRYGPDVLIRLRKQWEDGRADNVVPELAWLQPYIRTSHSA